MKKIFKILYEIIDIVLVGYKKLTSEITIDDYLPTEEDKIRFHQAYDKMIREGKRKTTVKLCDGKEDVEISVNF